MKPFAHDDGAFTGLEAAMVFIAFIVVASVFAYVALGAGFFTTQKTEQTVHSAVKQVGSVIQIAGPVMGAGECRRPACTVYCHHGEGSRGKQRYRCGTDCCNRIDIGFHTDI